jgi:putative glutamine amidotransferase
MKHNQDGPRWYTSHQVELTEGSILKGIYGESRVPVNSFHHQAVKDIAPGFVACGHAPDGVIEAIEKPGHRFLIGVQWHPECMFEFASPSDKLFTAFIKACHA